MNARRAPDSIVYGMSHEKLSLLASALVVGESFCCDKERAIANRETLTDSEYERNALADYSYDAWGCIAPELVPMADLENPATYFEPGDERRWARHYFERFVEGLHQ